MQRRIKARVSLGEISVNQLCWHLAEDLGAVEVGASVGAGINSGAVRQSFYSGFLRALKGLAMKGEVVVSSRVLTIKDVAVVYPYKTLRLEVRELRTALLPHLVRYGDSKGFNQEEVEARIRTDMEGTDKLRHCRAMWARIESRLWEQGNGPLVRQIVLPLIVCGCGYFGAGGIIQVSGSLLQHARAAKYILPEDVLEDLRALYRFAFDQDDNDRVASKGRFFAFADFGRHQGGVDLNDDVLRWLVDEVPDVVKALHGFVEEPPTREGPVDFTDWVPIRDHTFPLLLRRLVDRRIFEKHEFVRAA